MTPQSSSRELFPEPRLRDHPSNNEKPPLSLKKEAYFIKIQPESARSRPKTAVGLARWRFGLEPGELAFELGESRVEPLESGAHIRFQDRALRAVMARGGAAFDGVIKLLPARTASARALAGGD